MGEFTINYQKPNCTNAAFHLLPSQDEEENFMVSRSGMSLSRYGTDMATVCKYCSKQLIDKDYLVTLIARARDPLKYIQQ